MKSKIKFHPTHTLPTGTKVMFIENTGAYGRLCMYENGDTGTIDKRDLTPMPLASFIPTHKINATGEEVMFTDVIDEDEGIFTYKDGSIGTLKHEDVTPLFKVIKATPGEYTVEVVKCGFNVRSNEAAKTVAQCVYSDDGLFHPSKEIAKANAALFAEAGTVLNKTGRTPMELMKENTMLKQNMMLAVEFGYKQCEKGNNMEYALNIAQRDFVPNKEKPNKIAQSKKTKVFYPVITVLDGNEMQREQIDLKSPIPLHEIKEKDWRLIDENNIFIHFERKH
jgi:hypothetical protein